MPKNYVSRRSIQDDRKVEAGETQATISMKRKPNTTKATTDDLYADLEDKLIVLMQQGRDPLLLSTSTWALVQRAYAEQ
jgi:hypothetical protein